MSSQINITLKANDEASEVIADAGHNITTSMGKVEDAGKAVAESQKKANASAKDLVMGFSGLATSAFSLYNAYDRVADMQVNVDRANLAVKTSAQSLEAAQRKLNSVIEKYGENSEEAAKAQKDLEIAQERYQVATQRAEVVQGNMNEAMVKSALQVIPTAITMIGSISTITTSWTAIQGAATGATHALSGALNFLSANPIVLVIAGIAAIAAGLIYAYQNCEPFRNAINWIAEVLGGALSAAIDAVYNGLKWLWENVLVPLGNFIVNYFIAMVINPLVLVWNALQTAVGYVTNALKWLWENVFAPLAKFIVNTLLAAWNAFANGLTWAYNTFIKPVFDALAWVYHNVLKPIADFLGTIWNGISSIGNAIGGFFGGVGNAIGGALPKFAGGGVVTQPTLAWVGEAGPEAIIPLRYLASVSASANVAGSVVVNSPLVYVQGSADEETVELAAQRVMQRLRTVVVEASSSAAPSSMKMIRSGSVFR